MKIVKFEEFHVDCGWEIYSFLKISTGEGLTGWSEFKEHRRPGIGAAIHYPIPLHLQEGDRDLGQPGQFPVSEALAASILSLPLFPGITAGQVETCVASVESALHAR